jgi:hypothetical protein
MVLKGGKSLLNTTVAMCLLICAPLSHAGFGTGATARDWCKEKTLHYLKRHGYEPYNWVATTYIEGDNYVTEGEWSVDVDEIKVQCTANKRGKMGSGRYKILDVDISDDGKATRRSK